MIGKHVGKMNENASTFLNLIRRGLAIIQRKVI
jgi:hypothetical protein